MTALDLTPWNSDGACILPFNSWSKGNGTSDKYSGVIPRYGSVPLSDVWNGWTGFGYKYNSGDGYFQWGWNGSDWVYLRMPFDFSLSPGNIFAIDCWITYNDTGTSQYFVNAWVSGAQNFACWIDPSHNLVVGANSGGYYATAPGIVNGGSYHICVQRLSDGHFTAYVDGVKCTPFIDDPYTGTTTIGVMNCSVGYAFQSRMRNWKATHQNFTDAEVLSIYNAGSDMGLIGNNWGDVCWLPSPGALNLTPYSLIIAPASWSLGNGTSDQRTGNFPRYPAGGACAFDGVASGQGYKFNSSGYGHLDFSSTGRITTDEDVSLSNSNALSFSCWIYRQGASNDVFMIAWSGSPDHVSTWINASNQLVWTLGAQDWWSNKAIITGRWTLISFVKDGATIRLYIDGEECSLGYSAGATYNQGTITIAAKAQIGDTNYFHSILGPCLFSHSALTRSQILEVLKTDSTLGRIGNNSGDTMLFAGAGAILFRNRYASRPRLIMS
jgi:hypothetical protein